MATKKTNRIKTRSPLIMNMLLTQKGAPMHTRTQDVRRGSSRKRKHKLQEY